ncbi:MAG: hypothetical protein EXR95_06720 [Gemmatimonadetes bacterium]|nr:hypothetical protein [Gemmatimonadota bacterium]
MSERRRLRATIALPLAVVAALLSMVQPLRGQEARPGEGQELRLAGTLESRGQLGDAETVLRRLLDAQPTSVGGLFALDRVLRAQGRAAAALPYARRFLATDPSSVGVRYLELLLLTEVDSLDALERATEAWIGQAPGDPAPYRESAPLWERAFSADRALELLRRGRRAAGDPAALALEIGDLLLTTDHVGEAAQEWARGTGPTPQAGDQLRRRVADIADPKRRAHVVEALLAELERAPASVPRTMLAVRLAMAFQSVDHGFELARALVPELPRSTRRAFLEDLGRWADDERAASVSLWTLGQLRETAPSDEDARSLDARISRAALESGDTVAALAAATRLANELPRRSAERRRVVADRLRLEAVRADAETLLGSLEDFRTEYPDAAELDELAASIAAGLQRRGQPERAAEVIARVEGPRTSLERAYLLLATGDVARGRAALMGAVEGLAPARATEVIQLASVLGRLSGAGASALASAAVQAHRGHARDSGLALEAAVPNLPAADRPMVLAEAARLAAGAGGEAEAARMRAALLEGWPEAAESAEAALALARWRARTPDGVAAAIRLLEDLIVRAPASPVAPVARRELERLKRGA